MKDLANFSRRNIVHIACLAGVVAVAAIGVILSQVNSVLAASTQGC